ncbi:MAG: radical SAM protein [Deltaproteobacteria bacterium]|nr:radical SAM protein [Deltaproteobacteria bacterium]
MRVTLFLDHACNLRCTYCYNGEKFSRRMSSDVMRRAINLVLAQPAHPALRTQVSFFGGEPLLAMDLVDEAVTYARARAAAVGRRVVFHLVTNGTLMGPETVERLVTAQVQVAVSLDGCAAAHNATRRYANGRPSHADVAAHVRGLAQRVAPGGFKVMSVVDPANVGHLGSVLDAALELGCLDVGINVNHAAAWDDDARAAYARGLRELGDRYVAACRRGIRFKLALLDSKIITHLRGGFSPEERCDFGCEELAVAPSGRLYPCDRLVGMDDRDELVIGDVWRGVDVARRDALVEEKNAEPEDCRACALAPRCAHWCGCVNHAMTGRVGEVSGLFCWFEQCAIDEADRCAAVLHAERNAVFLEKFYPRAPDALLRVLA